MEQRPSDESTSSRRAEAGRLGAVKPLPHDEDERPSREDRDYGRTIFNRPPVPLPRFLSGRKKKR